MKKYLALVIVLALAISLAACNKSEKTAVEGAEAAASEALAAVDATEYEGTAEGHNGPIKVKVSVAAGKIINIELVEHSETEGIYDLALAQVIPSIIAKQGTEGVDVAAGATVTSNAIIEAVNNALKDVKLG